jgi:Peptidase family C25
MNHLYDKVIVTNRKSLLGKYSSDGLEKIENGLSNLVSADEKRGIRSRILYLDDKKQMRTHSVTNALDPRENKQAVDAVFKASNPHYLMILGAPDVLPHQDLANPAYRPDRPEDDSDVQAWGDLPYACDAPYSRDPARFVGPTRVVGRLPDLVGANEPSYLITLLKTATEYKRLTREQYKSYFGLSAEVWQNSTRLSISNVFGNDNKLLLAPPSGPDYPASELHNRMHFINCHGGSASPEFYGQHENSYPVSLTTQTTTGQIIEGTVAAVECCYGAQLYDSMTLAIDQPICQSYLEQGGYGYFGSTTIAYGPETGNGSADLICQYFLQNVLDGASLGHAALMARQQFVGRNAQMDAVDLKTLAQFYLLGDPSIHPIAEPSATVVPTGVAPAEAERFFRAERREKMKLAGDFLTQTKPTASKPVTGGKLSQSTRAALSNIAKFAGLDEKQSFVAYSVKGAPTSRGRMTKIRSTPSRYHVAIGTPPHQGVNNKVRRGVAIVAKELNGQIIGYRIYHQR